MREIGLFLVALALGWLGVGYGLGMWAQRASGEECLVMVEREAARQMRICGLFLDTVANSSEEDLE